MPISRRQQAEPVAILGRPPWPALPPNGSSYEIWGLNDLYLRDLQFHRWFELDELSEARSGSRSPGHFAWLQSCRKPVVMMTPHATIPTSVKYPRKKVMNLVGSYLTDTLSLVLALAIYETRPTIYIAGEDLLPENGNDTGSSLYYLLGIARGRGLTVQIDNRTGLRPRPEKYGYDDGSLRDRLYGRWSILEVERERVAAEMNFYRKLLQHGYRLPEEMICEIDSEQRERLRATLFTHVRDLDRLDGAIAECQYWLEELEVGKRRHGSSPQVT